MSQCNTKHTQVYFVLQKDAVRHSLLFLVSTCMYSTKWIKNGQPEAKLWTFEVYKMYSSNKRLTGCTAKSTYAQSYTFSNPTTYTVP